MSSIEKVAVIGLDCAEPSLMFEQWVDHLPNIKRLMVSGTYGELTSCMPPITVPAWSCMAASKDPGTLGIYGFRNRADHSYDKLSIATSLAVKEPRIPGVQQFPLQEHRMVAGSRSQEPPPGQPVAGANPDLQLQTTLRQETDQGLHAQAEGGLLQVAGDDQDALQPSHSENLD